jgi:lysozyme
MNRVRIAVAALSLSASGLVGIAVFEGYRETAYVPVAGDVATIGFGTTRHADGSPVQMGERTDPIRALTRKLDDVRRFEGALKTCVTVPLHQHEYDAFLSFAYNVGAGKFCGSTLVRRLNAGDYAGACAEFDRWVFFQGKDCRDPVNRCGGLVERRAVERAKCEGKP